MHVYTLRLPTLLCVYMHIIVIDWVTACIPLVHSPIPVNRILSILASGELQYEMATWFTAEGSFDSRLQFKSAGAHVDESGLNEQGLCTHLWLSGNPSKFLQGHNLFGSEDLVAIVYAALSKVLPKLGITPTVAEWANIKAGFYRLTRIDFTRMHELPTRSDVRSWIRTAEFKAKDRRGRPIRKGTTLTFGFSDNGNMSDLWAAVFYSKGDEIEARKHQLPDDIKHRDLLHKFADNKLRAEMRFFKKYLERHHCQNACDLTPERLNAMYAECLSRIDMSEQLPLSSETLQKIPHKLHMAYTAWRMGENLSELMPKTSFYRYRKQLREYGIDIAIRCETHDRSNVVALIRVLEAKPCQIPQWAFDAGLVHESAGRVA
jgi:II/X family phage/plasmid replication protein